MKTITLALLAIASITAANAETYVSNISLQAQAPTCASAKVRLLDNIKSRAASAESQGATVTVSNFGCSKISIGSASSASKPASLTASLATATLTISGTEAVLE